MQRRNFIKTTGLSAAGLSLTGVGIASTLTTEKALKRPVCVFTKCLQFLSIEDLGAVLGKIGFDGADISVRTGGHIEPKNAKTEIPNAIKILNKYGVETPMMVTGITDPSEPFAQETLQAAANSGIKYYRTGYYKYDLSKSIQQNLKGHKKTVDKLAALNEKLGIQGAYQNHSGMNVGAPVWDLYEILKDVDPRYMGVQYDIRHAVTEAGYSWKLGMKRIAPWIRTIDIKDFVWVKLPNGEWKHSNVPLGEGMVNFDEFLKEYASLKIEAPISIHYEYDLGGAEAGKKETTMDHEKIYKLMKNDLDWFRKSLLKNQIEN